MENVSAGTGTCERGSRGEHSGDFHLLTWESASLGLSFFIHIPSVQGGGGALFSNHRVVDVILSKPFQSQMPSVNTLALLF